jgi:ABC-type branched-subunit amino acid transport system ATPase component
MGLVLGTCDRVVVLDYGRVLAEGGPEEIRQDDRVLAAYLGDDVIDASTPGS